MKSRYILLLLFTVDGRILLLNKVSPVCGKDIIYKRRESFIPLKVLQIKELATRFYEEVFQFERVFSKCQLCSISKNALYHSSQVDTICATSSFTNPSGLISVCANLVVSFVFTFVIILL